RRHHRLPRRRDDRLARAVPAVHHGPAGQGPHRRGGRGRLGASPRSMPLSPDPWRTFPPAERDVLAVVRSVPAASRLLDAVHVFDGDDRVELTFALNPGSVSEPGVAPMLRAAGVHRIIGFDQAVADRDRFALALAASPKEGLHRLRPAADGPPLLLMP